MAVGPRPRAHAESASVEVVEDWELGSGVQQRRLVESEMEVVGFVESGVFPDDGAVFVDGDVEGQGNGAESGAVAIDLEDALEVLDHIGNGPHFKTLHSLLVKCVCDGSVYCWARESGRNEVDL